MGLNLSWAYTSLWMLSDFSTASLFIGIFRRSLSEIRNVFGGPVCNHTSTCMSVRDILVKG